MKFKKSAFTLMVLILITNGVTLAGPLSFGLEGGADLSNLDKSVTLSQQAISSGFQTTGFTSVTGFTGGAFGEWEFQPSFSLRAELFYSMKGTQIKTSSPLGYVQTIANFNYFEIPVLVRYQLPFNWGIKPSVFVGGSYSALLQVQQTTNTNNSPSMVDNSSSNFSSSDFNLIGGVEFEWQQWLLDARYSQGLSQIYTGDPNNGSSYPGAHNITFSILAGYRIW